MQTINRDSPTKYYNALGWPLYPIPYPDTYPNTTA